jgi:hypothetical protein
MPDITDQIKAAGVGAPAPQKGPASTPVAAPEPVKTITFTESELADKIKEVLAQQFHAAREAAKPKEPNWAHVKESDIYNSDVYIPAIEHEVPDYINIELADPEYMVVWASRDQRRIGTLQAIGYEFLKPEHIHKNFKCPLTFDSEKCYVFMDVVAMRVHKRILLGKRRKALQVSLNQLVNRNRPPRVREKGTYDLAPAISPEFGEFYSDIV